MRLDSPVEQLEAKKKRLEYELEVINKAIQIINTDRNWEIILRAQALI